MNLDERAILVALKIGLPTMTRRDKTATEDVERVHNKRDLGRFNKDLINKSYLTTIKSIESKARAYLYAMTVPWGDDDSRLLAVRRHMEFVQQMDAHAAAFEAEAATVIAKWDEIVDEARHRLGGLFDQNQYPTAATLPHKFRFRIGYTPVPVGNDIRVALDATQLAEMKARIDEDSKAALQATCSDVWARLYEKVDHMAQRLSDPKGRVHETVVSSLGDLCDILPDLNFMDDPRLNKAIALVKERLIVPVSSLRDDPEKKQDTAVAARKIADAMSGWMKK